jgi:hypothetical protein
MQTVFRYFLLLGAVIIPIFFFFFHEEKFFILLGLFLGITVTFWGVILIKRMRGRNQKAKSKKD